MQSVEQELHVCQPFHIIIKIPFRFCCDDPPREVIKSDSNEMLVLFRTFHESRVCDDIKYPWKCQILYTGFMAKYHIGKTLLNLTYSKSVSQYRYTGSAYPGRYLCMQKLAALRVWL